MIGWIHIIMNMWLLWSNTVEFVEDTISNVQYCNISAHAQASRSCVKNEYWKISFWGRHFNQIVVGDLHHCNALYFYCSNICGGWKLLRRYCCLYIGIYDNTCGDNYHDIFTQGNLLTANVIAN